MNSFSNPISKNQEKRNRFISEFIAYYEKGVVFEIDGGDATLDVVASKYVTLANKNRYGRLKLIYMPDFIFSKDGKLIRIVFDLVRYE